MTKTFRILVIIHTALAAFFLPMGLMYAVTGGLYGLDIKGRYNTIEHHIELAEPLPTNLAALIAVTEAELNSRGLRHPTGGARIRSGGTSFYFEWTGSRRDVQLHPTDQPREALLKVMDTTPHRYLVQLHKAKGGLAFRLFAAAWMVGLVSLFLTGGVMALLDRRHRALALAFGAIGLIVFAALALVS